MRYRVYITAYNRPAPLLSLLQQIETLKGDRVVDVVIFDDASTESQAPVVDWLATHPWVTLRRNLTNHGKKGFWRTYQALFCDARWSPPADYYCFLPDDIELCDDFFGQLERHWSGINDPDKVALNLLFDDRCRRVNWTGVQGELRHFETIDAWRTGWIDCMFACDRRFFEALNWHIEPVAATRWHKSEALSSGVGQQLSTRLLQAGHQMYAVPWSFVRPLDTPSQMHPQTRVDQPITALQFNQPLCKRLHITASLATIPARIDNLRRVVQSLLPQVSRLNVYLNDYPNVPDFLKHIKIVTARSQDHGDLGDAGKFWWCERGYDLQLTCDDDIEYPPDYAATMLAHVERYGRQAIIGVHGSLIQQPFLSYFKSRQILHCNADQADDAFTHIIGTGVAAWHTDTFKPRRSDFKLPNMGDIWMSVAAKRAGVPVVVVAHRKGWLKILENPGRTLYDRFRHDDAQQTAALQVEEPWFDPACYALVRGGHIMRGPNPIDHIFKCLKAGDFYERALLDRLAGIKRPGVWVDVGAHIGNHSVFLAGLGVPTISIEPNPALLPLLRENLARNRSNGIVLGSALQAIAAPQVGYLPGPPQNTGMGRLTPESPWTVPATTLDLVCDQLLNGQPLAGVKIDVEGSELEVLRGGLQAIRRHRPTLAIECATRDALQQVETLLGPAYRQVGQFCATPTYIWEPCA